MLDTLRYSKRLQEAGLEPKQAEAQAEALREALDEEAVTKADLVQVHAEFAQVRAEIAQLAQQTRAEFAQVRAEMGQLRAEMGQLREYVDGRFRLLYWMLGFNLALTSAVMARLLIPH